MKNLNYFNTLSKDQCAAWNIDMEEADSVMAFYNQTMNDTFEIDSNSIDTVVSLKLNDNDEPEVAYNIYKDGRMNQQVVNDYESARAVYRHIVLDEELIDPITGDIVDSGDEQ